MTKHDIAEGLIGHFGPDSLSEKQFKLLSFISAGGSPSEAGHIYSDPANARKAFRMLEQKAAEKGFAPDHDFTRTVPEGFVAKGVSTYYNRDGKPTGQWVKASMDEKKRKELLEAAVQSMCEEIKPVKPTRSPKETLPHLLTLYTFTDYHVGMLAWDQEGGDDWDVGIAEQIGVDAMRGLVASSPQSKTGIVNIQGDFMHYDGMAAVTPMNGHNLDGDSRFGKMVDISIKIIRQLVSLALQKHEDVILLICEGNHDIVSSLWLRKLFCALYENDKRVTVHNSEIPYYAIQHGNTMLGFHHGHMKKNDQLPVLFAAQFRKMWGDCEHVYIHCGHKHHKEDKEHSGARVIQHTTLAARDAYAARGGWHSSRAISSVTYHKDFGETGTATITPEMLQFK